MSFEKAERGQVPFDLVLLGVGVMLLILSSSSLLGSENVGRVSQSLSVVGTSGEIHSDEGYCSGLNGIDYNYSFTKIMKAGRGTYNNPTKDKVVIGEKLLEGTYTYDKYPFEVSFGVTSSGRGLRSSVGFDKNGVIMSSGDIKTSYYAYTRSGADFPRKENFLMDYVPYSGNDDVYIEVSENHIQGFREGYYRGGMNGFDVYVTDYTRAKVFEPLLEPYINQEGCIKYTSGYIWDEKHLCFSDRGEQLVTGSTWFDSNDDNTIVVYQLYYYKRIMPRGADEITVKVCFNVNEDSDGDGVDDFSDIAPNDPFIKSIVQVKTDLETWALKVETLQKEYDGLQSKISDLEQKGRDMLAEIADNYVQIDLQINKIKAQEQEINETAARLGNISIRLRSNFEDMSETQSEIISLHEDSRVLTKNMHLNADELYDNAILTGQKIDEYEAKVLSWESDMQSLDWKGHEGLKSDIEIWIGDTKDFIHDMRTQNQQQIQAVVAYKELVREKEKVELQMSIKFQMMQDRLDEQDRLLFEGNITTLGLTKSAQNVMRYIDDLEVMIKADDERVRFLIDITNQISALKDEERQVQDDLMAARIGQAVALERFRLINSSIKELEIRAGFEYVELVDEIQRLKAENEEHERILKIQEERIKELEGRGANVGGVPWNEIGGLILGLLFIGYWWKFLK